MVFAAPGGKITIPSTSVIWTIGGSKDYSKNNPMAKRTITSQTMPRTSPAVASPRPGVPTFVLFLT